MGRGMGSAPTEGAQWSCVGARLRFAYAWPGRRTGPRALLLLNTLTVSIRNTRHRGVLGMYVCSSMMPRGPIMEAPSEALPVRRHVGR